MSSPSSSPGPSPQQLASPQRLARQESSGEALLDDSRAADEGAALAVGPGSTHDDQQQQQPPPQQQQHGGYGDDMQVEGHQHPQQPQTDGAGAEPMEQQEWGEEEEQQQGDPPGSDDQQQQWQGSLEDEPMDGQQHQQPDAQLEQEHGAGAAAATAAEAQAGGGSPGGGPPEHAHDAEAAAEAAEEAALEAQTKLNELEAHLRQPDAVMEPGIMDRLREYVMANGQPLAAVDYLTDSYVGYAQMASLVCRWLEMTGPDAPAAGPAGIAAGAAAVAAAAGDAGGGGGAGGGAGGGTAGGTGKLDEAFYLRQLAKERFDPQLFATVFTSGGSGAPQWLNGLIAEPEGRQLVYELAGRYKNSLLLNFAIHKILMQPGREREVAAVGGSLAGYFGVFHRLMAAKLREAAAAGDEAALEALTKGLKEDCCASQHTYVHVQQVLQELARHPRGARFRRIAQELEEHAAALHGPVVWKMRQWFAEPGQPEGHYQAAALLSDILASSASGTPPASETAKLYRLYWPQEAGEQPPPISFLRHPRVFEVLLQTLFGPGRQLSPDAVQHYSALLALAAAADDRRPCGPADGATAAAAGQQDAQQQQQQAEQQAQQAQQQQQQQQPGSGAEGPDPLLDLSAVPATRAALEAAADLAQRVLQDQKTTEADMETAASVLEYPCCAAGLLRALGAQLSRAEYWQTAYHIQKSPPFLQLLALVVPRQPALHGALLQLLGRALTALGNSNHDIAKGFLSIAVQLVSAGRVFEVLRWAEEWKARADPSLVRHLVFGVLEVSAPPYSPDFAGSMLRIMMAAGIRRQRLSARDWGVKALLDEFSAACAQVQFKPPLSAREAQFLQDISADRPPSGY